jgi:hypothetical protein
MWNSNLETVWFSRLRVLDGLDFMKSSEYFKRSWISKKLFWLSKLFSNAGSESIRWDQLGPSWTSMPDKWPYGLEFLANPTEVVDNIRQMISRVSNNTVKLLSLTVNLG